jgi:hypothetical protein
MKDMMMKGSPTGIRIFANMRRTSITANLSWVEQLHKFAQTINEQ